MNGYNYENIRNIALLGHGGCGKTTFLDASLLATGVIKRLGSIADGNTVSDHDKMEIAKKHSISTTLVPVEIGNTKINFLDTPGFFDFIGEVYSALKACEGALIFVDASAGIQVGTEKAWNYCNQFNLPRFFVISKTDKENVDVSQLISDLRDKFGTSIVTLDDKDLLNEAIAETDEELLEKFFSGEAFTEEEFHHGFVNGLKAGDIAPVLNCSSTKGENISEILKNIVDLMPYPGETGDFKAVDGNGEDIEISLDDKGKSSAFIFKTIADPFLGKVSLAKVVTGEVKLGQELYNTSSEKAEKLGAMFFLRGKNHVDSPSVKAGDIFAIAKLQHTKTGDTLCLKGEDFSYETVEFPSPTLYMAVEPEDQADDEKMGSGLHRLMDEDPSFVVERNNETHQMLLGGQGEIQLNIVIEKLKDKFGVHVREIEQKIPYRETIRGNSDVQGKHKKQSGGAGQYGDVHIRFSPSQEEFEFTEELFGGSIPKNYVPAVEKGLKESMVKGPLAGYKVVNVKAVLYDGSYHDVDSNEMSFKIAASLAFKKGIVEANPCLLEPIMHVDINVPDSYMGDVMGDMNKRRGKILGMEPQSDGSQRLLAEAPQAELFDYAISLRSMTQARGSFSMKFERYEPVPAHLAEKIIEEHNSKEG